jgi:hypothetical protein
VNEHIFAAIVSDDEAETLLRIEEFDDALALANDLRRHSATRAAAAEPAAATAAATKASATAATAVAATAAAIATAAAAAIAKAAAAGTGKAAAVTEATAFTKACACEFFATTETVALVTAATTAVTLTPSIETHEILTLSCPKSIKPTRWANGATGRAREEVARAPGESLQENWRIS